MKWLVGRVLLFNSLTMLFLSICRVGAGSPIMGEAVQRIASALNGGDANSDLHQACLRRSFVLSVDQAHAVHPNYASKHEKGHQPKMNGGMVIKRNSNQRYATNGITGFLVRELAKKAGLPPVQEFLVRNDCACGSTIGPIISTATGIRAIDMGCPQLSMHSIRETMGVCDCKFCTVVLRHVRPKKQVWFSFGIFPLSACFECQ